MKVVVSPAAILKLCQLIKALAEVVMVNCELDGLLNEAVPCETVAVVVVGLP